MGRRADNHLTIIWLSGGHRPLSDQSVGTKAASSALRDTARSVTATGKAMLGLQPHRRERLRHMIDKRPHRRRQAAAGGEDEVDDAHLAAPAGKDADEAAGAQIGAADMIG